MHISKRVRKVLVKYIKRYTLHWYAVTALLYFAAIPFTIWVFPATTLILTVVVLVGGFTAALASFADALMAQEQDDRMKEIDSD
jgi:fatty acid desaturase